MAIEPQPSSPLVTTTVVRIERAWYVLATSSELRRRPLAKRLHGVPLVVFRGADGKAGTLLDRCPHRNIPLSAGQVVGPHVRCAYHGWEFDTGGVCRKIPGLAGIVESRARNVVAYPTVERDGYVWVWADPAVEPDREPYTLPTVDRRYTVVRYDVEAEGSLHQTIENALDVPHTAYLHGGLFRSSTGTRNDVRAIITRSRDQVQAEYVGEPRPPGLAARLLSPSGGVVTHYDRFFLPSITQVEYQLGEETHFRITGICTPVEDFRTRLYAVIQFRVKLVPNFLVTPFLAPIALRIFSQDARILRAQTAAIHHFGEERFVSTEIDILGAQILRLMKRAAAPRDDGGRGEAEEDKEEYRKEILLRI
jgi:phenylpropionate dioxygenase-like ring-hydroxylating dioxygenase large terminal subunit